jgi:hypothetical protein
MEGPTTAKGLTLALLRTQEDRRAIASTHLYVNLGSEELWIRKTCEGQPSSVSGAPGHPLALREGWGIRRCADSAGTNLGEEHREGGDGAVTKLVERQA